jgi:hypothetical protein
MAFGSAGASIGVFGGSCDIAVAVTSNAASPLATSAALRSTDMKRPFD